MSLSDYALNAALVLLVLRQLRARRVDRRFVLLPLVLVGVAATNYLHTVPTAGHDLVLVVVLGGIGAVLGTSSAAFTRVWSDGEGHALARAGVASAILWVLGVGARMAFSLYAQHGGADAIGRFSVAHQITGGAAWTAALVIMALAEVISRVAVLTVRAHRATAGTGPSTPARPAPVAARA